jgi:hypothetical protein
MHLLPSLPLICLCVIVQCPHIDVLYASVPKVSLFLHCDFLKYLRFLLGRLSACHILERNDYHISSFYLFCELLFFYLYILDIVYGSEELQIEKVYSE